MKDLEEQRQESRILIVDDNLGTVRVLAEILKEVGKIYFTTKSVDAYYAGPVGVARPYPVGCGNAGPRWLRSVRAT